MEMMRSDNFFTIMAIIFFLGKMSAASWSFDSVRNCKFAPISASGGMLRPCCWWCHRCGLGGDGFGYPPPFCPNDWDGESGGDSPLVLSFYPLPRLPFCHKAWNSVWPTWPHQKHQPHPPPHWSHFMPALLTYRNAQGMVPAWTTQQSTMDRPSGKSDGGVMAWN